MSIIFIVLLLVYLVFTTWLSLKLYKKLYYHYYPIILEDGTNLHDQYPEFKKHGDYKLNLTRLIIMMPIALIRLVSVIIVILIFYLCMK